MEGVRRARDHFGRCRLPHLSVTTWTLLDSSAYLRAVEIFLEWLYTQQYPRDQCFGDKGQNRKKQLARIKACEFGDRFLAHAFRAVSESALVDDLVVANRAPYYDSIMYAHQHLRTNSPVLKAMVDAHCYGFIEQSDTERNGELKLRSQLPHEFLVNVMVRYMRLQLPLKKKPLHRCDYHGHTSSEDGGEKCKVPRIDDLKKDVAQKEQGGQ